ncbi:MAG TPA: RnfABCDGE type electron transport complex subunit D [Phycisphaerae bacterium]|nr:RnfABCDGE type electron transport complex subunit D [Phycisphaerae bacterium]
MAGSAHNNPSRSTQPTAPGGSRLSMLPVLCIAGLFAFALLPDARANARLFFSIIGAAAGLSLWGAILLFLHRRSGRRLAVEVAIAKPHYVQAVVQIVILAYWGWYWPRAYDEIPLIAAQLIFFYALDALLAWSRGRVWRFGFGPMPIVISTNLLLWFKHDWYFFQFLLLTTGALAKQFITWDREGQRRHIFNPSAFAQSTFAVVLIATGMSSQLTWGREIAASFETPYMLLVIFLGGLVVQYLFHVTLMTLAATATLLIFNLIYTGITDLPYFVTANIVAPIFLGLHLLVTDPATSPRTNLGRVLFGSLYGLGFCALFRLLDHYQLALFWDKLLPVPILNLCVPLIDRICRAGMVGRLNSKWETCMFAFRMNLVHMTIWILLFVGMWRAGFIQAPLPKNETVGETIIFWKRALAEGKPNAGHSFVMAVGALAEGSGSADAFNELGLICIDGTVADVERNDAKALKYFDQACEMGSIEGCANVAIQYLYLRQRLSDEDVAFALEKLEESCDAMVGSPSCYLLGSAYETGRSRPKDAQRALELYERSGINNLYAVKGIARITLAENLTYDLGEVAPVLEKAALLSDAESNWYLGYMHLTGNGVAQDPIRVKQRIQKACQLGSKKACNAANQPELPPFANPEMQVPGWTSAYPVD